MAAALNLVVVGCGSPQWPRTHARADPQFMSQQREVRTIDILPPDIQVWTASDHSAEDTAVQLDSVIRGVAATSLATRGYHVLAQLDWDGTSVMPDGAVQQAMPYEHLDVTTYSLAGYGHAMESAGRGLLVPYLPYRLGVASGADATLYIGGWAYVGKDPRDNKGAKIAQGVVVGLLLVAVVAVIFLTLKKGGGGGGGGRVASGVGRAAARVAMTAGRTAGRVMRPVIRGAARASAHIARGMARSVDAFGRADTHIHFYAGRPSYYDHDRTPKKGRSRMGVEMTLVDNRTGLVLWHTRDIFPAHAPRMADVHKVFDRMLANLPAQ